MDHATTSPEHGTHPTPETGTRTAWRIFRDGIDTPMLAACGALVVVPNLLMFVPGAAMYCQTLFVLLVAWRLAGDDNPGLRFAPMVGAALGLAWTVWHLALAPSPIPHSTNPRMDFAWTMDQDLNTVLFAGGMIAFALAVIGMVSGSALTAIGRFVLRRRRRAKA